jgi:hypothetical protein
MGGVEYPPRSVAEEGRGTPSRVDRAAALAPLLTLPAIMDACAVFGADPSGPLPTIVAAAARLRPTLAGEIASAGQDVADNMDQVVEACMTATVAAMQGAPDAAASRSLHGAALSLSPSQLFACAFAVHISALRLLFSVVILYGDSNDLLPGLI